jgi:hypothetical protein
MKIRLLLLMVLLSCAYNVLLAEPSFYIQTKDNPFHVPGKNYGILWDNHSLTKTDDITQPHPHSSLQHFSKNINFPRMLNKRYFRIKLIPYEKPTVLSEEKDGVLIKYNGYQQAIFLQPKL